MYNYLEMDMISAMLILWICELHTICMLLTQKIYISMCHSKGVHRYPGTPSTRLCPGDEGLMIIVTIVNTKIWF